MGVHLSILGIILAALSAMVVGMIWYSPGLFGKSWMKMIGLTEKDMKKDMASVMPALIIVSLLTATVLSYFIAFTHNYVGGSWIKAGFTTSLFTWIGFSVTTIFAHGLFEPRNKKILYINSGNRLFTLVIMGLILGAIH